MMFRSLCPAFALLAACPSCRQDRAADAQERSIPVAAAPASSSSGARTEAPRPTVSAIPEAGVESAGPCPKEMVSISRYCIDRWEAHLVRAEGEPAMHPHYERPTRGRVFRAVSAPGVFPQAYINRVESEAACRQAGKRLCTLGEWYRACHGTRGLIYPYGNSEQRNRCNSSKPHLLSRLFGSNPNNWRYDDHFNSPRLNQEPGFLARTGDHDQCESGEGVLDLVGNLHEWVSDRVDSSLPAKVPLQEDILKKVGPRTGNAIFMGGFFSTTSEHGRGCRFTTIGHEATYHDYSTGFRCCKDASR